MHIKEKVHKTTCCYCGVGCGMLVKKDKKGKITVDGDPGNPVNKGMLCSKGMNLHYTAMDHSDRLLYPMLRDDLDRSFKRISWETAIQKAASKFKEIIEQHGPDAVGFYVSGQCLTEEYYLANKIMKGFIGSNNIDTNSRLCMSSAVSAYKLALGEDSVPGCYEDIELADTFLISGANPVWCHPILYRRIEAHKAKNSQVKIIVVDPRRTQTAAEADLHLQIFPGTDIVLYHAIARGLIENNFIDRDFIRQHTEGFKQLKQKVMQRSLQEAAAICGIKFTDIYKAIKYIGYSGGFISMWAMGHNQSVIGVNKNLALINLSLLTGKIGKPGSGPFSLTGQANAMGGREVGGMATLLSAHRDMHNPVHRKEIADYWKVAQVPDKPGLTATEMFDSLRSGKMKAIWIMATNPMVSIPDANLAEAAIRNAEFVVAQDMSAKADTIQFAHLVLPAATWLEKEGTMTNSERRISHLSKVMEPPGEALPDAEILLKFAKKMGWENAFNYKNSEEIFQEHALLTKGTRLNISRLTYHRLKQGGSIQWPVTKHLPNGTQRLFTDHRFYRSNGKAQLHAVEDTNLSEDVSESYPLVLTTGRIRDQWHTMTRTGKVNKLKQHIAHTFLEIHPSDAGKRKITDGDPVVVFNDRGNVQVTARITDRIKKGVVFLPMHWGRIALQNFALTNNLTSSATDALSRQPGFKYSATEVIRYKKPLEKIIILGESSCIPVFIREYRRLNATDEIVWITQKPDQAFYDRTEMIKVLNKSDSNGGVAASETMAEEWNINMITGRSIVAIATKDKNIIDDQNENHHYDQLIFAGGMTPSFTPVTDTNFHWSNKQKLKSLMQNIAPGDELVLTGENPFCCEAATVLSDKGITVHLVTERQHLFESILDKTGSTIIERKLTALGIRIHCTESIQSISKNNVLTLRSGHPIACRAVIDFSYDLPDSDFLKCIYKGEISKLPVDEFLQSDYPGISVIGPSAATESNLPYQPVAGNKQAASLAKYMYGNYSSPYSEIVPFYTWAIGDLRIMIVGHILLSEKEEYDEIVFTDLQQYQYKKCVIQNDRLVGLIFIGDQEGIELYQKLIEAGTELGELRHQLLQPGISAAGDEGKIICSCRQVGEHRIRKAIRKGCNSVDAIGTATGAGSKCGSCKPELKILLDKYKK